MKKLSRTDFINRAISSHGLKYNYSETKYINLITKLTIRCPIHGTFNQLPKNHLNGHGCSKCTKNCKITQDSFIMRCKEKHNSKYCYNDVKYLNRSNKIKIMCNKHGYFFQIAKDHLDGHGCPSCSKVAIPTISEFISSANKIHNNRYNYSCTKYKNSWSKIIIICYDHGKFSQTANSHIMGAGCPKCHNRVSKPETEFLDKLRIAESNRQISLLGLPKRWKVDGYDPKTNTVYEFLGSYWHGDPLMFNTGELNKSVKKTFGALYEKTITREIAIRKAGYKYQFIWELDWKNK